MKTESLSLTETFLDRLRIQGRSAACCSPTMQKKLKHVWRTATIFSMFSYITFDLTKMFAKTSQDHFHV